MLARAMLVVSLWWWCLPRLLSAKWLPVVLSACWLLRWLHAVPAARVHVHVGVVARCSAWLALLWDCRVGAVRMTVLLCSFMPVVVVVDLSRWVLFMRIRRMPRTLLFSPHRLARLHWIMGVPMRMGCWLLVGPLSMRLWVCRRGHAWWWLLLALAWLLLIIADARRVPRLRRGLNPRSEVAATTRCPVRILGIDGVVAVIMVMLQVLWWRLLFAWLVLVIV